MAGRTRRVVWGQGARNALDAAVAYIAEDSPEGAKKVLDVVLRTASSLDALSERGRVVPEVSDPTIREAFVYSYRLMYRVTDEEVQIVGFVHGAREFRRWRDNVRRG